MFTGLRVYALCNQNTWAFLLVFALGMVSFFTNMVSIHFHCLKSHDIWHLNVHLDHLDSIHCGKHNLCARYLESYLSSTPALLFCGRIEVHLIPFNGASELLIIPLVGVRHIVSSYLAELLIRYHILVSLSTRIALIIADVIVLAVTWRKAASTVKEASRINVRVPLSEVLIRDGEHRYYLSAPAIDLNGGIRQALSFSCKFSVIW